MVMGKSVCTNVFIESLTEWYIILNLQTRLHTSTYDTITVISATYPAQSRTSHRFLSPPSPQPSYTPPSHGPSPQTP